MRFTQFYAGPVCSPTRANLQSGQDQARFGITPRYTTAEVEEAIAPLRARIAELEGKA